jgi:hypothetical protein
MNNNEENNFLINNETSNDKGSNVNNVIESESPKSHCNRFLIVFCVIIGCLLITLGIIEFVVLAPKNIVKFSINSIANKIDDLLLTSDLDFNKPLKTDTTFNMDTNYSGIDDLKDYQFNIMSIIDTTKNQSYSELNIKNSNKNIINIKSSIDVNNDYFDFGNIYNEILNYSTNNKAIFDKINFIDYSSQIKILNQETKQIYINELTKYQYQKNKEKINLNNKNYQLDTIILSFDKDTYNNFSNNIVNALTNDQTVIDALGKILKKNNSDTIAFINNNFNNNNDDFNKIDFVLYTQGITKKFVGIATIVDDNSAFKLINVEGNGLIYFKDNNGKELTGNIYDGKNIIINYNDETINIIINDFNKNNIDFDYTWTLDNSSINGNLTLILDNDNIKGILKIKNDDNYFTININSELSNSNTLPSLNTSNAKSINDLTENDYYTILNNIDNQISGTIFATLVQDFYGLIANKIIDNTEMSTTSMIF